VRYRPTLLKASSEATCIARANIPGDPTRPEFRQGAALGDEYKHWFRAKFFQQYRLFFRYHRESRILIYAWVDDEDAQFTCKSRRVASILARVQKAPVYRYLFTHTLENDPEQSARGPIHTIEHPFLFAWEGSYRPTETDLAIQRSMVGYW